GRGKALGTVCTRWHISAPGHEAASRAAQETGIASRSYARTLAPSAIGESTLAARTCHQLPCGDGVLSDNCPINDALQKRPVSHGILPTSHRALTMLSYTCLSGFSQVRVRVNLNSAITDQLVVRPRIVQLGWILALGVYIVLAGNLIVSALIEQPPQDHYYYQAVSWLHGQLDIDNAPTWMQDIVTANGHRYLPLGPMPAVLALPLVAALGERYRDALLVYPLAGLTAFLAWRILKRLNVVRVEARLWLAALFILGTVYFSAAVQSSGAWFVAHIVTCFFLFLGIDEALGKKRPLVMGACLGLATAARFTALFTFPFFLILLSVNDSLQLSGDAAHNN